MQRKPLLDSRFNLRGARLGGCLIALALCLPALAEPVVIQYWEKWSGEEGRAMERIVERFNASQDEIRVEYSVISQIDQKLLLSVLGKSPPDVAGLWAPFVAPYSERGLINPLDGLIEEAGFDMDALLPAFRDLCTHRGGVWALPSSSMSLMLYTNKQVLIEAGYSPLASPTNMDELAEMGKRLTLVELVRDGRTQVIAFSELTDQEIDRRDYDIVRLGFDPTTAQVWLPYLSGWFGGEVVGKDGSVDYQDPGLVAALAWYHEFFETYGLDEVRRFGSSYGGASSSSNPFFTGRVAMALNGPWLPKFIEEFVPGLEYNVGPMPTTDATPAGNSPTLVDSDILVIPRGAAHPREAFTFLAYVNSPAIADELNRAQSKMSPLRQRGQDFFVDHPNPFIARFYEAAEGEGAFLVPGSVLFSRLVSDLFTAFDFASGSLERSQAFLERAQGIMNRKLGYAAEKWERRGEALRELGNLR